MSRNNWTFPRRKQRKKEAAERQAYYDSLSVGMKLVLCDSRRGESKKERNRLNGE